MHKYCCAFLLFLKYRQTCKNCLKTDWHYFVWHQTRKKFSSVQFSSVYFHKTTVFKEIQNNTKNNKTQVKREKLNYKNTNRSTFEKDALKLVTFLTFFEKFG